MVIQTRVYSEVPRLQRSGLGLVGPILPRLGTVTRRWHIERLFQDAKSHIGLDHFEVRNYLPVMRHLILGMLSLFFLVRETHRLREKKPPVDRASSEAGHRSAA